MYSLYAVNIIYVLISCLLALAGIQGSLCIPRRFRGILWGTIFGICAVLTMKCTITVDDGMIFDFRHVVLALAGFVGGWQTALLSSLIAAGYRLSQGGIGAWGGVIGIFIYGQCGLLLKWLFGDRRQLKCSFAIWFLIGIGLACTSLMVIFMLPPYGVNKMAFLQDIALPFVTLTPVAVVLLFNAFLTLEKVADNLFVLKIIFAKSPVSMMVFDDRNRIVMASEQVKKDKEIKNYLQNPLSLLKIDSGCNSRPDQRTEDSFITSDGDTHVFTHVSPVRLQNGRRLYVCVLNNKSREINNRRKLEGELIRLDRLNLIGEMAAGIGHEIRNPMTTVRGLLQMMDLKENRTWAKDNYKLMISELDRANSIISEFLSLSRNKQNNQQLTDLNTIVKSVAPLISAECSLREQTLSLELQDLPPLMLDGKEIRQLIHNLTRNGIEAMRAGKTIFVQTRREPDSAVLVIKDEGCGFTDEAFMKSGTPFFTTKENGTGLGLAVCYGIAAKHDARLIIASDHRGTTAEVWFQIPEAAVCGS